jgi:mono/diheme cytochrome c family protein
MRFTLLLLLGLVPGAAPLAAADPAFTADQVAFYEKEVRPLLTQHCVRCHGKDPEKLRGGLALTSRAALLKGGDTGPAVAGKPDESLLVQAVRYKHAEEAYHMPPAGKLPDADIAVLTKWVKLGVPFATAAGGDGDPTVHAEKKSQGADKSYWAFQPVKRPAVPAVKNAGWVRTPVDAFVLAKQEAAGVTPVVPAEPMALIRRMTYDLTGLPPSPAEVEAFAAAAAKNRDSAVNELIERLLASPAYGEKWGRHWLDVVRYAETNGYERDGAKPFAWRYRDYVIKSFNADKPYDRFLKEQLAGDEMPRKDGETDPVVATGFYRLGLWDDEPADPELARYDGLDDLVTTVGQGMLGMSLNCARCHDHKGDFFPQEDYYKLVAFFRDIPPNSNDRNPMSSNNVTDISQRSKRAEYEEEFAHRTAQINALVARMKPTEDGAIKKMPPKDQLAVEDGKRAQVVRKVPQYLEGDAKRAYLKLRSELQELQKLPLPERDLALSVNNALPSPPQTHLLVRGNPGSKGKPVTPGFPEVFGLPDPAAKPANGRSGRRTSLADWVASPDNPLTARVMVNRVWQHHFGKGVVPTPNDFGKFGEKPTNPELLDYLASEFVAKGWSVKALHRLILKSSVYQLSSAADATDLAKDPANTLRWRFDVRRLTSEEVRDTMLSVAGQLDRTMFGPSVYPKIPAAVLAGQSVPGNGWHYDAKNPAAANRRSVYVHVKRSLQVPVLATHDQADPDSTCPVRYTTTVPTQALGLLNGEFSNELAADFAARLVKDAPGDVARQVARGLELTTGRPATPAEVKADVAFVQSMKAKHGLDDATALTRYALLLLNTNAFAYLD